MNNTEQAEFFVEKILQPTRSTFEMFGMYVAVRLGYYKALSDGLVCNPPIEPAELPFKSVWTQPLQKRATQKPLSRQERKSRYPRGQMFP